MLYAEIQNYQKAAEAYEQVYQLCREDVDALKAAAKVSHLLLSCIFVLPKVWSSPYQKKKKCGQVERSICILEYYLKSKPDGVNASVVDLLGAILIDSGGKDILK
ncbi:TPR protein [Medicago truncatula]|uniref:TPR protein n=1 Tax=Medicago truncatula TaxID=3880 RepID=G7JNI0_MEDTR|nr:TPR protein [Medicago truncatula]